MTQGSNSPTAPRSCSSNVRTERPITASASRAGAPVQPGSSLWRSRTAATPSAPAIKARPMTPVRYAPKLKPRTGS